MNIRFASVLLAVCLSTRASAAADDWWNSAYNHRLPVQVRADGVERTQKPVEVELDFARGPGPDDNSLRVVEVDADGRVLDDEVPFQFEKTANGAAARGTLVLILRGTTRADATRRYHVYFRTGRPRLTASAVPAMVAVSDHAMFHETMDCFKIETLNATYYYGKKGAGFASIVDRDGKDWISYRPGGRGAGEFRGLPKFGQPEKLFHCGYGFGSYAGPEGFTSVVTRKGPIHVRIDSETRDKRSSCTWDFYPSYAVVTLHKIALPTYWFLYEGTPGGKLDADQDFVVRANGRKTPASEPWSDNVPWAYVGAGEVDRALFMANHQKHDKVDSYVAWPFQPEKDGAYRQMTVLGFGRKGYKELIDHVPDLSKLPARFTIGFTDVVDFPGASRVIESAYKDVTVSVGAEEHR